MSSEQTTIYRAANPQQAHLLRSMLEERGMKVIVTGEGLQSAAGELPMGWNTSRQVVVSELDAKKARDVVLEFERRLSDTADEDENSGELDDSHWSDWPVCPSCARCRQAVCPVCETADMDFPLAEYVVDAVEVRNTRATNEGDNSDQSPILLICPNCDESFPPRFYRFCEDCGHDFGFGIELANHQREEVNHRAVLVVAVLGILALGFIGYFWFLFAQ